jgi:hypothetical protein
MPAKRASAPAVRLQRDTHRRLKTHHALHGLRIQTTIDRLITEYLDQQAASTVSRFQKTEPVSRLGK